MCLFCIGVVRVGDPWVVEQELVVAPDVGLVLLHFVSGYQPIRIHALIVCSQCRFRSSTSSWYAVGKLSKSGAYSLMIVYRDFLIYTLMSPDRFWDHCRYSCGIPSS